MSPLSNANYNKIVNVIYTIVSDKLQKINEAKQKNGKFQINSFAGIIGRSVGWLEFPP